MGPVSSRFTIAIHILALLAIEAKDQPTTSDYLARSAKTNPVVIRRILAQLGKASLVAAQSGTHGGIKLARPAAQINLREVYQAVEKGAIFSFGSRESNPHCICGHSLEPVAEKVFRRAELALENVLAEMTVAELAAEVEAVDVERQWFAET